MGNIKIERIIPVPRSYIWSIVGSFDKSPSKSYRLEISKHGDPDKEGIGTERILYSGNVKVYERIISAKREEHFEYEILSGMPVKYYKGRAEFFDAEDGTRIVWTGDYKAGNLIYGLLVRILVSKAIIKTIKGLEQNYIDLKST
ncbi:SRPBCC family protein [Gudongella oleilytica]|jgi:hypothetical protein|uniref:SRPBCC family protein n=1 Tax=Gudongella oleilytica TaxID=1582259 RepID=UPI000FF8A5E6|nr:SRPBCC family protein [Gudongella oleilytica]